MMICHSFITVILLLCLTNGVYTTCVHDEVQPVDPVKAQVIYEESTPLDGVHVNKWKRSTNGHQYQAIRLKFFYLDFDFELTEAERIRIQKTVTDAISFIEHTFSVIPVNSSLLLKRTGCRRTWHKEPNAGKCAVIDKNYREEYCHDAVKIPEAHLGSLKVYPKDREEEVVFPAGKGIPDADTVLYITAKTTKTCYQRKIVLAYSGYCQLDQYDRPIAGYINFCPFLIRATNMTQEKVYMSVVHELFHVLGFSKGLFGKFRDCSRSVGGECPRYMSRVVRQIYGITRLVTSTVIQHAQNHFGCLTEERFGGPLHVENGVITSHWSPKLMYGSIMAPKLGMAHQTVIDPLTLAFFEDTGWYKVDYDQAGLYLWGKDTGCKFGSRESCQKSNFFCKTTNHKSCHYLHKDKGQCQMVDRYCGLVDTEPGDQCSGESKHSKTSSLEVFGPSSLCFMSNLTLLEGDVAPLKGMCFQHRCDINRTLEVKIDSSDWVTCYHGDIITVPGFRGYMRCPDIKEAVCPLVKETVIMTTLQESSTITPEVTMWNQTSSILYTSPTSTTHIPMTNQQNTVSSNASSFKKFQLHPFLIILHSIIFMVK
ncbi:ciliated left-right organizer metallopeptidase-like [Ylistrum balloti]|uniref:ciliated left-right organizer metallopeptidase-like n=1 Tax=Ylistrum balloti TaxID=509963 RepID=UPI0029059942|nr:ciliated left-right organizer metallopeptidase-like [Ylistrum balloti]XP_060077106.1 ciliated left-right organizer metallopeptidase-like [Ylistrum balloti]